jgi:hypothetical protein
VTVLITLGADKGYDAASFVADMRALNVTPQIVQNVSGRRSGSIDGVGQDGGQPKGAVTPSQNFNGNGGAIDFSPDQEEAPQTDGPSPKSTPGMTPIGHQVGGQGTGGDQANGDAHSLVVRPPSGLAETNAQHLAQELQGAADTSHTEDHETAQEVGGAHTGNDIASVVGAGSSSHDHSAFADLIRLAQNPVQAGLLPPPAAPAHDAIATLHLGALGDLAAHAAEVHHVDDVHAVTSATLSTAIHDAGHLAAPVIDHGHVH